MYSSVTNGDSKTAPELVIDQRIYFTEQKLDFNKILNIDESIFEDETSQCCPITSEIFIDPVFVDGYNFERAAIAQWFGTNNTNPITRRKLPPEEMILRPNSAKKSDVNQYRERIAGRCNEYLKRFLKISEQKKHTKYVLDDGSRKDIVKLIQRTLEIQPENSRSKKLCVKILRELLSKIKSSSEEEHEELIKLELKCTKIYHNFLVRNDRLDDALLLHNDCFSFWKTHDLINMNLLTVCRYQQINGMRFDTAKFSLGQVRGLESQVRSGRRSHIRIVLRILANSLFSTEEIDSMKIITQVKLLKLYRGIVYEGGHEYSFSVYHLWCLCTLLYKSNQHDECLQYLVESFPTFSEVQMVKIRKHFMSFFLKEGKLEYGITLGKILLDTFRSLGDFYGVVEVCELLKDADRKNIQLVEELFQAKVDLVEFKMEEKIRKLEFTNEERLKKMESVYTGKIYSEASFREYVRPEYPPFTMKNYHFPEITKNMLFFNNVEGEEEEEEEGENKDCDSDASDDNDDINAFFDDVNAFFDPPAGPVLEDSLGEDSDVVDGDDAINDFLNSLDGDE